jgi:CheY-like chemotaxis protein
VFTLTLPLSEQPATVDPAPDLNRNGGFLAGCRVLLVDDHPDTLFAMSRLLRSLTSYVKTASCVADALRVVETEPPFDLVISDLGLPDGTGHDLLRQILARCPVRAIALTGFGMEDDLKRSREAGFDAHLTKPINFEDLRTTIERVLTAQYTLETPCTAPV